MSQKKVGEAQWLKIVSVKLKNPKNKRNEGAFLKFLIKLEDEPKNREAPHDQFHPLGAHQTWLARYYSTGFHLSMRNI